MAANRAQTGVLVSSLVALGVILVYEFWPSPTPLPGGGGLSSAQLAQGGGSGRTGPAPAEVPAVRLEALAKSPEAPSGGSRNPFRVQPRPLAPAVLAPAVPAPAVPASETATEQVPSPPPPITLRFIGLIEAGSPVGKIAVLSDGRDQFYGREGEIIDGRYRIIRIGVESVDMTYVDGRGARRIPLSGG